MRNGIDLLVLLYRGVIAAGLHADTLVVAVDALADIDFVADLADRRMVIKNGVPARVKTDGGVRESRTPADNVLRFISAANAAF